MKNLKLIILALLCVTSFSHAKEHRIDSTFLKTFESYAQQALEDNQTPGMSIAIVQGGKVIYAKGFGVKEVGKNDPVDEHTIFQIGSISKSFTSALVAKAVTEKKLDWNDHVIDHWSDFMMFDPAVTREFQIEDTLAQRSGLSTYAGDSQLIFGFPIDRIMHNVRYIEPITSFRSAYAYQNVFFSIVAKVLEIKTGATWNQMIESYLFRPLGMKESSTTYEKFVKSKNVVSSHKKELNKAAKVISEQELISQVYTYGPAGGINSNCLDMAKWLLFQLNHGRVKGKQLISEENMDRMHTPHVYLGDWQGNESYYCLGWIRSLYDPEPIIWHDGGTNGSSTMAAMMPSEDLGIVILTNARGPALNHAVALQFFDLYFGKTYVDWSKKLTSQLVKIEENKKKTLGEQKDIPSNLSLANYEGTFHSEIFGDAIVKAYGEMLQINFNEGRLQLEVKPFAQDSFRGFWQTYLTDDEETVNFYFGDGGELKSLYIEMLGAGNQGHFDFVHK